MTEDTELLRKDLVTAFEHLLSCWSRLESLFAKQQLQTAEVRRVRAILDRDKADAARERMRQEAVIEFAKGVFVNLSDSVLEPTPEWLGQGETKRYTPRQPEGTVREITTVRRVITPIVARLNFNGKLSDDDLKSCLWLREVREIAGLEGRYISSRYSESTDGGASKGKRSGGASGHIPTSIYEAHARDEYRRAISTIPSHLLKFFEAVVFEDMPLRRAERFIRCRNGQSLKKLKQAIAPLTRFCLDEKVSLKPFLRND